MAWLEPRDDTFQIALRVGNRRLKRSLPTCNREKAEAMATRVDRRLRLLRQGDTHVPEKADLLTFLLSDGRRDQPLQLPASVPLSELFTRYQANLPSGALGQNSRRTIQIQLQHVLRILGRRFPARDMTVSEAQRKTVLSDEGPNRATDCHWQTE